MIATSHIRPLLGPAIERALAAYPAAVARRATRALRVLLGPRCDEAGEITPGSSLTGDGFPVEFTFATADQRLRYTVDPADPSHDPADALGLAHELVTALDPGSASPAGSALIEQWTACQQTGPLKYGAWIGGRHDADSDAYKLYAEVPPGAAIDPATMPPPPRLSGRVVVPRMLGYAPRTGEREAYYRVADAFTCDLPRLLAPCGLADHAGQVVEFLAGTYAREAEQRLPGGSIGVSYASRITSPATPHAVTFYFFARALWGGDTRIRRALLRADGTAALDDVYEIVTRSLACRDTCQTYHGLVGLTLRCGGGVAISIGVRPAEVASSTVDLTDLQQPDGCFASRVVDPRNGTSTRDCNGFAAALVLRAIRHLPTDPALNDVRSRALDYLEQCRVPGTPHAFTFWPAAYRPAWAASVPPDADDTAVMMTELFRAGRLDKRDVLQTLCRVLIKYRLYDPPGTPRPPWIVPGSFLNWLAPGGVNGVDCCVNANVIALMAVIDARHLPGYQAAIGTIERGLDWAGDNPRRLRSLTPFYPSARELQEALRHAVECGARELSPAAARLDRLDPAGSADDGFCCDAYGASAVWHCDALAAARALRDLHV